MGGWRQHGGKVVYLSADRQAGFVSCAQRGAAGATGRSCSQCHGAGPSSSAGTELHPPSVTLWAVLKDKPASKYFIRRLSLREMKLIQSKCCANE